MDTRNFGFDPTQFMNAPLQTEGRIRFTDLPDTVFARLADYEKMTEWVLWQCGRMPTKNRRKRHSLNRDVSRNPYEGSAVKPIRMGGKVTLIIMMARKWETMSCLWSGEAIAGSGGETVVPVYLWDLRILRVLLQGVTPC